MEESGKLISPNHWKCIVCLHSAETVSFIGTLCALHWEEFDQGNGKSIAEMREERKNNEKTS